MNLDETKIGNLELDKGLVRKDISMYAWDGIRECTNLDCPVVNQCKYLHRGKCAVQVQYITALYNAILGTYSYLDESLLFKIGTEIVPLYVHLIRLQIVELSLATPVLQGMSVSIHPVYKEIRATLTTINMMWKALDVSFEFGEKVRLMKADGKTNIVKKKSIEHGDPEFYQRISQEGSSRKGVIR